MGCRVLSLWRSVRRSSRMFKRRTRSGEEEEEEEEESSFAFLASDCCCIFAVENTIPFIVAVL